MDGKGTHQGLVPSPKNADPDEKIIDLSNCQPLYAYKNGVLEAGDVTWLTTTEGYLRVMFQ